MTGVYTMIAVFQQLKAIRECLRIRRNYFTLFGKEVSLQQERGHFHTHCYLCYVYYRQVFNELTWLLQLILFHTSYMGETHCQTKELHFTVSIYNSYHFMQFLWRHSYILKYLWVAISTWLTLSPIIQTFYQYYCHLPIPVWYKWANYIPEFISEWHALSKNLQFLIEKTILFSVTQYN